MNAVNDCVENLRYFLDTVDKHLRSLEILGQNVNQAAFVSVIKSELPSIVIWQCELQKKTSSKWTVQSLRELLREYVTAYERVSKAEGESF